MMNIKYLAIIICIVFNLTALPVYSADTTGMLTVTAVNGELEQTIDVTVSVAQNPGIAHFKLLLYFDNEILLPLSLTAGAMLVGGSVSSNISMPDINYISATWFNAGDITGDGVLYTVRFKIKDGASGSYDLNLSIDSIFNQAYEDVNFDIANTRIHLADMVICAVFDKNDILAYTNVRRNAIIDNNMDKLFDLTDITLSGETPYTARVFIWNKFMAPLVDKKEWGL